MAYAALTTIQTIATGQPFLAATLQQANDSLEFLINPPACSVYNSTPQSLTNNTLTVMTADSENFDNDSMHSTASNTSRITIQTAGRYLFFATVRFPNADVDGHRFGEFLVDGTTRYYGVTVPAPSDNGVVMPFTRAIVLTAGQYVEARVRHTAGAGYDAYLDEFAATFLTR